MSDSPKIMDIRCVWTNLTIAAVAGEVADVDGVDAFPRRRLALDGTSGGVLWWRRTHASLDADIVDGDVRKEAFADDPLNHEAVRSVCPEHLSKQTLHWACSAKYSFLSILFKLKFILLIFLSFFLSLLPIS